MAGRTLRGQVRTAIGAVVLIAVLLFAVPLGVLAGWFFAGQAQTRLQREATRAVAVVPDDRIDAHTAAPAAAPGTRIGVYDRAGRLVSGSGPRRSELAAAAADGRERDGHEGGELAVVLPVRSDTTVVGTVRAAAPQADVRSLVLVTWALLAALAAGVWGVALALAHSAARRVSRPFEELTAAARDVESGRYQLRLPAWRIAEADAAGEALRAAARAVDELLRHERDFVRHASHQLRTPLAGLILRLEQASPDVPGALERAAHLAATIEDLVAVRADPHAGRCDPMRVAAEAAARWDRPGQPVTFRGDETGPVAIGAPALRQSLDVLLDNATRHGRAPVTVTVEPLGDTVVVEVDDAGPGFPDGAAHGTGLTLVDGLLRRAGGTLLVRRASPRPRVALLLPPASADPPARPPGQPSVSNR